MNLPLHVLHVLTNLGGFGGIQEYVTNLVTRLDRNKFQVEIAVGPGDGPCLSRVREAGIPVHHISSLIRSVRPLTDLQALLQLVKLLRSRRYDIVHTHMTKGGFLGRIAARLARIPLVVAGAHNFGVLHFGKFVGACFWLFDTVMVRCFTDLVISVSEQNRREAIRLKMIPPHKIVTVTSGIDLPKFLSVPTVPSRYYSPAESLIVGTVTRLVPVKGIPDLLHAMAEVVQVFPSARLLIVGDGPERVAIERHIGNLSLSPYVTLLGDRSDVVQLLSGFDVFVLASHSEGLPIAVMEAMAAGCPIIATQVGGIPELITHDVSGILVPPRDVHALAQALLSLLLDHSRRQALGRAARQTAVQHLSLTRMASEVEALYLKHCCMAE